jgi:ADP-ribose pyrophosphatase YjhB (NUDIX family)
LHRGIPNGDNRERLICRDCGFIHYRNPVVVGGAVVTWGGDSTDRFLLCRRAIDPQKGLRTIPAGYLELEETTEAGAVRKTWEGAQARISIDRLLAVYNVPRLPQVQTIYHATLLSPNFAWAESSSKLDCSLGSIFFGTKLCFQPCAGRCTNIARLSAKPITHRSVSRVVKAPIISDLL